jgi:hypothetical protein
MAGLDPAIHANAAASSKASEATGLSRRKLYGAAAWMPAQGRHYPPPTANSRTVSTTFRETISDLQFVAENQKSR